MSMYQFTSKHAPGQQSTADTRANYHAGQAAHALATVTNARERRALRQGVARAVPTVSSLKSRGGVETLPSNNIAAGPEIATADGEAGSTCAENAPVASGAQPDTDYLTLPTPAYDISGLPTTSQHRIGNGEPDTDCLRSDGELACDCELGRVAICRHELSEFRVWAYAHKFANGEGRILKSELSTACRQLGIASNRRTFSGTLARGNRLYWRERNGYLYLTSWRKLSQRLTRWEAKYHPDHVATNRPGQRRVQLDLSGSLKLAHATIYNGWLSIKAQRNGYLEISRWTLERLWGRNRRQLRSWEKLVGIRVEYRYAENTDIHNVMIPAHANLCLDKSGGEFSSWQISNRIYPADTTISATKGQGRKVRSAVNHAYNSIEPTDLKHGGLLRVQRTGRLYFTERSGKNGNVSPYKQIDKHLIKHGDIFQRQHYAYLTTRYGKHIYEYSFDGSQTRSALCERDRLAEQGVEFRLRHMQYRIGWVYRML